MKKQMALQKMLKEMETNKSQITERIHVYLCNVDDSNLIKAICSKDKNLHEATQYLYAQGSKIAQSGVADVTDEMEQKWTREYYLNKKIDKKDFKILPPARGERVEVEKIKEVEKIIYKTPSLDEIGEYLAQQSQTVVKKPKKENQEVLSLDI